MSNEESFEKLYNTLKEIEEKINEIQGLSDKERYSLLNLIERAKQQVVAVENNLLDISNKLNYLTQMIEKMNKRLYYIDRNTSQDQRSYRRGGYKGYQRSYKTGYKKGGYRQ